MNTFEEKFYELKKIEPHEMSERDRKELLVAYLKEFQPKVYEDMRNTLKYYDSIYLTYEYGRWEANIGLTIKAKYADDYIHYGEFDKSYFEYTKEELNQARQELAQCQWF